jgi:ribose transport system ATP-binding protein
MLVRIAGMLVSSQDNTARLYVMDEPTAALTGAECERLFAVIDELKRSGATVLFVSHRMNEVMRICDRVTVYRDGRTIETRAIADTSREAIIQAMTGRDLADTYPERTSPLEGEAAIRLDGVSTGDVSGLDFAMRAGEILGIAGLADAGQSEVLHALLGDAAVTAGGAVLHDGGPLPASPHQAWTRGIAYVPRERRREALMLKRGIVDNTVLPHLQLLGRARLFTSRARERAHTLAMAEPVRLRYAGLDQPCHQLSGGNQQKVVFARALGETPRLLLLDEPTRGVDVGAKFDIYTLIRDLSAKGCATVMTSSDLPELIGLCDRIVIMRDRRQHAIVETAGLTPSALLQMFYEQE